MERKRCGSWVPLQMYCYTMFAFLLACLVRSFGALLLYKDSLAIILFKSCWIMFWYECATRTYTNLKHCHLNQGGIEEFVLKLEKICYSDGIIPYEGDIKFQQKWLLGFCFFSASAYAGLCGLGFYGPTNIQIMFQG